MRNFIGSLIIAVLLMGGSTLSSAALAKRAGGAPPGPQAYGQLNGYLQGPTRVKFNTWAPFKLVLMNRSSKPLPVEAHLPQYAEDHGLTEVIWSSAGKLYQQPSNGYWLWRTTIPPHKSRTLAFRLVVPNSGAGNWTFQYAVRAYVGSAEKSPVGPWVDCPWTARIVH